MAKITEYKTKKGRLRFRAVFCDLNRYSIERVFRSYEEAAGFVYTEWFQVRISLISSDFSGFFNEMTADEAVICWIGYRYNQYKSDNIKYSSLLVSNTIKRLSSDKKISKLSLGEISRLGVSVRCQNELAAMMNFFLSLGLIKRNPFKRRGSKSSKFKLLGRNEVNNIAAKLSGFELVLFQLCCVCGLRRGEAIGLKMEDLGDDFIIVRRNIDNATGLAGETKTGGQRIIHVSSDIIDSINSVYIENSSGWIFYNKVTKRRYSVKSMVAKIKGKTGFSRMHLLRHRAASRWIAEGMDINSVSYLLGHSSPSVTLRTYAHLIDRPTKAIQFSY